MPRPIRPWFRFYVEALADRKIRRLKPAQRWVWIAVLGAARESHDPGSLYIAPGLPMTVRELAAYADVPEREVATSLAAMEAMAMVRRDGDLIVVTNWNARQFESDNVTARTRDHRERSQERSNNVPGNAPEKETETETEDMGEVGEGPARPAGAPKRAHQLPADFIPNETNRRIASERGLDLRAVYEQFADHHRAKGSTMKDWHLALNTWLRRERTGVGGVAGKTTNVQAHLALVQQMQAEEAEHRYPQIGGAS